MELRIRIQHGLLRRAAEAAGRGDEEPAEKPAEAVRHEEDILGLVTS
jgi:hypothetical protein